MPPKQRITMELAEALMMRVDRKTTDREIAAKLGLKSASQVKDRLFALPRKKGWVKRHFVDFTAIREAVKSGEAVCDPGVAELLGLKADPDALSLPLPDPAAADDTPVVSHCNTDATQERTPDEVQRIALPFTEEQIGVLQRIAEREMDRITIRRTGGKAIPFSGRMDPAVYEALKAHADAQQITVTEGLTRAVESYLKRAADHA